MARNRWLSLIARQPGNVLLRLIGLAVVVAAGGCSRITINYSGVGSVTIAGRILLPETLASRDSLSVRAVPVSEPPFLWPTGEYIDTCYRYVPRESAQRIRRNGNVFYAYSFAFTVPEAVRIETKTVQWGWTGRKRHSTFRLSQLDGFRVSVSSSEDWEWVSDEMPVSNTSGVELVVDRAAVTELSVRSTR